MTPKTYSNCYVSESRLCLSAGETKTHPPALGPEDALGGSCPVHPSALCGTHQASALGSQPPSFSKEMDEGGVGVFSPTLRMDVKDPLCVCEDFSRRSIFSIIHS